MKLLLDCQANANAKNESKSTPLHIASNPYNYVDDVCIICTRRLDATPQPLFLNQF